MTATAISRLDGALDRARWAAPSGRARFLALGLVAGVVAGLGLTPGFAAAVDALQVRSARVPASDQIGGDRPLLMTSRNDATEADARPRVRCPFANFSEQHPVDRGERA